MRRIASLLLALLILAPAATVLADDGTLVRATYLGHGMFQFKDKAYGYNAFVAVAQAAHPAKTISFVIVDMGTVASQLDKATVCQLRQSLQTRVEMHLTVEGNVNVLYCNDTLLGNCSCVALPPASM
jgi:hypothetical protein